MKAWTCDGCHAKTCVQEFTHQVREGCDWIVIDECNLGLGVPSIRTFCSWRCVSDWALRQDPEHQLLAELEHDFERRLRRSR